MSEDSHCPDCGDIGGEVGTVCSECNRGIVEETAEELKALLRQFDQPPMPVIGEGRKRPTDLVEYVDADAVRYNTKYGLDEEGNPLASDVLMGRSEAIYGATISEGFDMLSSSDDHYQDDSARAEAIFGPNGFNTW